MASNDTILDQQRAIWTSSLTDRCTIARRGGNSEGVKGNAYAVIDGADDVPCEVREPKHGNVDPQINTFTNQNQTSTQAPRVIDLPWGQDVKQGDQITVKGTGVKYTVLDLNGDLSDDFGLSVDVQRVTKP